MTLLYGRAHLAASDKESAKKYLYKANVLCLKYFKTQVHSIIAYHLFMCEVQIMCKELLEALHHITKVVKLYRTTQGKVEVEKAIQVQTLLREGKINRALRLEAGLSIDEVRNKDEGPRGHPTKLLRKNILESLAGGPYAKTDYSDADSSRS